MFYRVVSHSGDIVVTWDDVFLTGKLVIDVGTVPDVWHLYYQGQAFEGIRPRWRIASTVGGSITLLSALPYWSSGYQGYFVFRGDI